LQFAVPWLHLCWQCEQSFVLLWRTLLGSQKGKTKKQKIQIGPNEVAKPNKVHMTDLKLTLVAVLASLDWSDLDMQTWHQDFRRQGCYYRALQP
jgi:hypothetical protein